ncbi:MAG: hypothetical protein LBF84_01485 [Holosporales bacterium]|nr:hypothetical protein [Holosporales bacterium]
MCLILDTHMTRTVNDVTIKHFAAWKRFSKYIHSGLFTKATAKFARNFLEDLIKKAPYKILSEQK